MAYSAWLLSMKKNLISLVIIIGLFGVLFYQSFSAYEFYDGIHNFDDYSLDKPAVLLIDFEKGFGGSSIHFLNFYKALQKHGHRVIPLVRKDSALQKRLVQDKVAHYAHKPFKIVFKKRYWYVGLPRVMANLCRKHTVAIIHCNYLDEVSSVRKAADSVGAKAVFTWHGWFERAEKKVRTEAFAQAHGFISVDKKVVDVVKKLNEQDHLGIAVCEYVAPFFNADPFLNFRTNLSCEKFFKETFNLELIEAPLVVDVANYLEYKNPLLLVEAAAIIIFQKKLLLNVVFAGGGHLRPMVQNRIEELGLEKYVHTLGFTDKTPGLFYYADCVVLPSKDETFGLVLLEAALMKKPVIGIRGTGMENVIIDKQSGLLSTSGNAQELADHIEYLIKNPQRAAQLGHNAYGHVVKNFLPDALMSKIEAFYAEVLKS